MVTLEPDSVGVLLPKIVLPYLRQWAANSGFEVLSKLLVDEQLLSLIARYGDQLIPKPKPKAEARHVNGNGRHNGNTTWHPYRGTDKQAAEETKAGLAQLYQRVSALEGLLSDQQAELAAQQAMLQTIRAKVRPLALALGCCPECVVGLELCPNCFGKSEVGYFEPDLESLRAVVLDPLAARGVSLTSGGKSECRSRHRTRDTSTRKKGE